MENFVLQIEQLNKSGLHKQKKHKKGNTPFLDILKQNENTKRNELNKENSKIDIKVKNSKKQEIHVTHSQPNLSFIIDLQQEKINQNNGLFPQDTKSLNKEKPLTQNAKLVFTNIKIQEKGTLSVSRFDAHEPKQDNLKLSEDTKLNKDSILVEAKSKLEKNHAEINTKEVKKLEAILGFDKIEKTNEEILSKTELFLVDKKNDLFFGEKKAKSLSKQGIDEKLRQENSIIEESKFRISENIKQELDKKSQNKDSQIDKSIQNNQIYTKHKENKNLKEILDTNIDKNESFANIRIVNSENFGEISNINQDNRQLNYQNQEAIKPKPDIENTSQTQTFVFNNESFSDNSGQNSSEFNFNQHNENNSEIIPDKNFPTNKFSLSFNFMDTKIDIHTAMNSIILHINTSQVIDPATVEKIRQILTENGFLNNNIIIKDKTKTTRTYTYNKTLLESRNTDGFKISA